MKAKFIRKLNEEVQEGLVYVIISEDGITGFSLEHNIPFEWIFKQGDLIQVTEIGKNSIFGVDENLIEFEFPKIEFEMKTMPTYEKMQPQIKELKDKDIATLSKGELNNLINKAIEDKDYTLLNRLRPYIKESSIFRKINEDYDLGFWGTEFSHIDYAKEVMKKLLPIKELLAHTKYPNDLYLLTTGNIYNSSTNIRISVKTEEDLTDIIKKLLKDFDDNLDLDHITNNVGVDDYHRSQNDIDNGIWYYYIPKKKGYWDWVKENQKMRQSKKTKMDHEVVVDLIDMAGGSLATLANLNYSSLDEFLAYAKDYLNSEEWNELAKRAKDKYPLLRKDNIRKYLNK